MILPRRCLRTFGFAWDLRGIDFLPFDVLHAHGDDWFLWSKSRPWHVHTFHGSCLAEALHAPTWIGKLRMAALAACEMSSLLLADVNVAVSENTRRYIPRIRHVIPCGVDTAAFRQGTEKSPEPSLLFVGTIHGRKRGRMLLDLFRRTIRIRMPDAEMWCVCDRPDGEADGDGVRFLGRVDHQALTGLYRRAWVFCLPSTYEGFGVPYIEAMASGTAVVASPNPGAREVLGNGRWGAVCSDNQLAEELVAVLANNRRRSAMEEAGVERARAFSWEFVAAQYERLYVGERVPPTARGRA